MKTAYICSPYSGDIKRNKNGIILNKTQEELNELNVELDKIQFKLHTGDEYTDPSEEDLITEIADVEIMLKQLKMYFDIDEKVEEEKKFKIQRTLNRIEEETEGK